MFKYYFGDDGFQNMFVYQPTLNTLELKEDKDVDVVGCKSKVEYNSKVALSTIAFLHNIKLSEYMNTIQQEHFSCRTKQLHKIVSAYIVYNEDNWPKIPLNNFKLKNCLCGATSIVKNSNKSMYIVAMIYHLTEVCEVLVLTLLEML